MQEQTMLYKFWIHYNLCNNASNLQLFSTAPPKCFIQVEEQWDAKPPATVPSMPLQL